MAWDLVFHWLWHTASYFMGQGGAEMLWIAAQLFKTDSWHFMYGLRRTPTQDYYRIEHNYQLYIGRCCTEASLSELVTASAGTAG